MIRTRTDLLIDVTAFIDHLSDRAIVMLADIRDSGDDALSEAERVEMIAGMELWLAGHKRMKPIANRVWESYLTPEERKAH